MKRVYSVAKVRTHRAQEDRDASGASAVHLKARAASVRRPFETSF